MNGLIILIYFAYGPGADSVTPERTWRAFDASKPEAVCAHIRSVSRKLDKKAGAYLTWDAFRFWANSSTGESNSSRMDLVCG